MKIILTVSYKRKFPMGLQGPSTRLVASERTFHCKLANEVTRYPEKSTEVVSWNFKGTCFSLPEAIY